MREITSHKIDAANSALSIHASAELAGNGASLYYDVTIAGSTQPLRLTFADATATPASSGLTNEALISIAADRILSAHKQSPTGQTQIVINKLSHSIGWLKGLAEFKTSQAAQVAAKKAKAAAAAAKVAATPKPAVPAPGPTPAKA